MRFQPGFVGGGVAPLVKNYQGKASDFTNLTNYTFTAFALGAAAANRYILVGVTWDSITATTPTMTIDGVTATNLGVVNVNPENIAFYIANVPTHTTGDIVVTGATGATECFIMVWRLTGLLSTTPVDFVSGSQSTTPSAALPLNDIATTAGGAAMVIGYNSGTVMGGVTGTWTGSDTVTEREDTGMESTSRRLGVYDFPTAATVGTNDFTITWDTVGGGNCGAAAVSLR
jgi:hypothetical protein